MKKALSGRKIFANTISADKIIDKPTEGVWFLVNPKNINQKLFKKSRKDHRQEETRWLIQDALAEAKKHPEKYGQFETMRSAETANGENIEEHADNLGGHVADWIEQALEWAQRIANGETWEEVCNEPDTSKYFRLIYWKTGKVRIVGGSCIIGCRCPASDVCNYDFEPSENPGGKNAVPLVARTIH